MQRYGLYQEITTDLATDGSTLVGHTGGAYGFSGIMFVSVEQQYGITVFTDGSVGNTNGEWALVPYDTFQLLYQRVLML